MAWRSGGWSRWSLGSRSWALPHAPAFLAGLLRYRGDAIPVVDLGLLMGGEKAPGRLDTRIVLVEAGAGRGRLGLVAERVEDVVAVDETRRASAGGGVIEAPYLGAVYETEAGLLLQLVEPSPGPGLLGPSRGWGREQVGLDRADREAPGRADRPRPGLGRRQPDRQRHPGPDGGARGRRPSGVREGPARSGGRAPGAGRGDRDPRELVLPRRPPLRGPPRPRPLAAGWPTFPAPHWPPSACPAPGARSRTRSPSPWPRSASGPTGSGSTRRTSAPGRWSGRSPGSTGRTRSGGRPRRSGPRYFREVGGRYSVDPEIRRSVRFRVGNLLDPGLFEGMPPFDVVFCRNLLIYFDAPSRARAFATLARLTAEGGLLFLGHADRADESPTSPFRPIKARGSFGYRKGAAGPEAGAATRRRGPALPPARPIRRGDGRPIDRRMWRWPGCPPAVPARPAPAPVDRPPPLSNGPRRWPTGVGTMRRRPAGRAGGRPGGPFVPGVVAARADPPGGGRPEGGRGPFPPGHLPRPQ